MALVAAGALAAVAGIAVGSLFGTKNAASEIDTLEQSFINNITNINNSKCDITNAEVASGTRIILNNSNVGGNIIGSYQAQQTQATCLLTSTMSTNIQQAMKAIAQQEIKIINGTILSSGSDTSASIKIIEQMTNNLANINNQMCTVNNVEIANDTYIYARNSNVSGNVVGVYQTSNAASNCAINNTMKNVTFQQAQARSAQGTEIASILGVIVIVVVLVIVAVVVIAIVFALLRATKKPAAPTTTPTTETAATPPATGEAALLQQLLASRGGQGAAASGRAAELAEAEEALAFA